jgi:hypothetical protein
MVDRAVLRSESGSDARPKGRRPHAPLKHLRTMEDLDGRSHAAKRAYALVQDLQNQLGSDCTCAQRELVKRAAFEL